MSEQKKNPQAKPAPKAVPAGGGMRGPRAMGPMQPINKATAKRLIKYVVPFWPRLIVVLLCIVINAVATASAATFLGRVIDEYITPLVQQAVQGLSPDFSGLLTAAGHDVPAFTAVFNFDGQHFTVSDHECFGRISYYSCHIAPPSIMWRLLYRSGMTLARVASYGRICHNDPKE